MAGFDFMILGKHVRGLPGAHERARQNLIEGDIERVERLGLFAQARDAVGSSAAASNRRGILRRARPRRRVESGTAPRLPSAIYLC